MKRRITGIILIVLIFSNILSGMQNEYGENQCERVAKDLQIDYGGSLVFILPLKTNGAYDLGELKGHWINHVGREYIDYGNSLVFDGFNLTYLEKYYSENVYGRPVKIWDMSILHPPFAIKYNYK